MVPTKHKLPTVRHLCSLGRYSCLQPKEYEKIARTAFFKFVPSGCAMSGETLCKINEHGICIFDEQGRAGSK
jgi:hypothetical protein